jgi:zinc transporter ZupT
MKNLSEQFSHYSYSTQAIIATLIVSALPVLLMSLMHPFLKNTVKDVHNSRLIQAMYAFTFGALIGDVFYHMFPELSDHISHQGHGQEIQVYTWVIFGMIFWYILEVTINTYFHGDHDHSHVENKTNKVNEKNENKQSSAVTVALIGDLFHNFTDGLAIASTFTMSPKLGFVTMLACFVHEIPHEIGDFAYLFKNGYTYLQALSYQLLTGLGALLGCIISLQFSSKSTIEMVAFSGGTFIYMSLCLFMDDLRKHKGLLNALINVCFMGCGLYSMIIVAQLE